MFVGASDCPRTAFFTELFVRHPEFRKFWQESLVTSSGRIMLSSQARIGLEVGHYLCTIQSLLEDCWNGKRRDVSQFSLSNT